MDTGQSSSTASPAPMDLTIQEEEMEKLHQFQNALEFQFRSVEEILKHPSEIISRLFKDIRGLIAKSKEEESNENNISNLSAMLESTSSDISCFSYTSFELWKLQKFCDDLEEIMKNFTSIAEEERDENVSLILQTLRGIIKFATGSFSGKETQHPLQNDVVLREFFKNFKSAELVPLRLVCCQWNEIITPMLRKRDDYYMDFAYQSDGNSYTIKNSSPKQTLNELTQFLSTSPLFPILNFEFRGGDLRTSDTKEFFSTYGKIIKWLRLCLSSKRLDRMNSQRASIRILRSVIFKYATNLEELILEWVPKEWNENSDAQSFGESKIKNIQLPSLVKLHLPVYSVIQLQITRDIIQSSPNLKEISGYKVEYLDSSLSDHENRLHLVKDFVFHPTAENWDNLVRFANSKPQLEEFPFFMYDFDTDSELTGRAIEILQKILESSKDSIKWIPDFLHFAYLPILQIPVLKNCVSVYFVDSVKGSLPEWITNFQGTPRPLNLAQILPNLENIDLNLRHTSEVNDDEEEYWTNYFDWSKPLPWTKKLAFSCGSCSKFVDKLAEIFPKVETIDFSANFNEFPSIMPAVWKGFRNLKEISVTCINVEGGHWEISVEQMNLFDSAVTGFSPDFCEELRNRRENVKVEDVEALRESPSICDAKKLKSFKVSIPVSQPIFSHVSDIFGVRLMQERNGLKTDINFVDVPKTGTQDEIMEWSSDEDF